MFVGKHFIPFSNNTNKEKKATPRRPSRKAKGPQRWAVYDQINKEVYYLEEEDGQDHKAENELSLDASGGDATKAVPARSLISSLIRAPEARTVRVFVSSTFTDMVGERDELNKTIFPRLAQLCQKYRVFFSAVDLRWGITEEDSLGGQTISICLNTIDQSRPYFLGCVGDRYGWSQPGPGEGSEDKLLRTTFDNAATQHPWVNDYRDRSITELECLYGALFYPDLASRAAFYIRKGGVGGDTGSRKVRLDALKRRVIHSGLPYGQYSTLREFSEMVYRDFEKFISTDFGDSVATPLQQQSMVRSTSLWDDPAQPETELNAGVALEASVKQDRLTHQYFAQSMASNYLPASQAKYFPRLDEFATVHQDKTTRPFLIEGTRGSGKGALLASWFLAQQKIEGNVVLGHFVNASSEAQVHTNIISHIKKELILSLKLDEGYLQQDFGVLLQVASEQMPPSKRIIIAVEGIDQINAQDDALSLNWLPVEFPANIFVVTCADSDSSVSSILKARGSTTLQISRLSRDEQEAMTQALLEKYSKKLTAKQIASILGPKTVRTNFCGNPLYLVTLLEELRVCGSFDHLDQQIAYYCTAKSVGDLYVLIMKRWEKEHGGELVRSTFSLLACSRKGLSESELQEMVCNNNINITQNQWQVFRTGISTALTIKGGLLVPVNADFSSAIRRTYLNATAVQKYHMILAEYFHAQAYAKPSQSKADEWGSVLASSSSSNTAEKGDKNDSNFAWRYLRELPWHLEKIDTPAAKARLRSLLSDPERGLDLFELLYTPTRKFDLLRHWTSVEPDPLKIGEIYQAILQSFTAENRDNLKLTTLLEKLCVFLEETSCFDLAGRLWRQKLSIDQSLFGPTDPRVRTALLALGRILEKRDNKADIAEGLQLANTAFNICKRAFGMKSIDTMNALQLVALLQKKTGEYKDAGEKYALIIKTLGEVMGEAALTHSAHYAIILNQYGDVFRKQAKYPKAVELYQKALDVNRVVLGPQHPLYADTLANMGLIHKKLANYEAALDCYNECLPILREAYGEKHVQISAVIIQMADVERKIGNLDEAERLYRQALEINSYLLGPEHMDTIEINGELGLCMKKRGDYKGAQAVAEQCLEIVRKNLGDNHYKYAHFLNQVADCHRKKSDFNKALAYYNDALRIFKTSLGVDHVEVAEVLSNISLIYKKLADYDAAESSISHALAIAERACGQEHPKVADFLNKLADIYRKRSQYYRAEPLYLRAIEIMGQSLGENVELVDPLIGLATTLKGLGRYSDAEPLLQRARKIVEAAHGDDHPKMATCLQILGDIARKKKNNTEAEKLYKQALAINEKMLGPEDIEVAENLRCLSLIHQVTAPAMALEEVTRSLKIVEKVFGADHAKYASFVNDLANVQLEMKRYSDAALTYNKALALNQKLWGERHPEVAHSLNGLGVCIMHGEEAVRAEVERGKKKKEHFDWAEQAERYLQESIDMTEATLGPMHPHMAARLNDLAALYKKQGYTEKAAMAEARAKSCK